MVATQGATSLLMAFYLLHKSMKPTVSSEEIEQIWHKVDVGEANVLDVAGVGKVLVTLGYHLTEKELTKMMVKHFKAEPGQETLEKHIFVMVMAKKMPSAAMGTVREFV